MFKIKLEQKIDNNNVRTRLSTMASRNTLFWPHNIIKNQILVGNWFYIYFLEMSKINTKNVHIYNMKKYGFSKNKWLMF